MTTFQAIIYGIIQGFTQFLPVSAEAHRSLVPFLLGWSAPEGYFAGALTFAGFLAIFVYFRHDWASLISSTLQVIIFRKRPMTIDERLPIFISLSCLPLMAAWYYAHERLAALPWTPVAIAVALIVLGLPLWFSDSMNKRNKSMSDWNWVDALYVGVAQVLMLIPGSGLLTGSLIGGLSRHYNREAAAKFGFYLALPILGAMSIVQLRGFSFHAASPATDVSWLSFWIATIVCLLTSLLAIGGFMKNIQKKGFGQYIAYRFLLGFLVIGFFWYKSRHAG